MMGKDRSPAELVAILLAIGISTALNVLTIAAIWAAILRMEQKIQPYGLSENTTQVLTGWGGGMIGVLGAFVGYTFNQHTRKPPPPEEPPPPAEQPGQP